MQTNNVVEQQKSNPQVLTLPARKNVWLQKSRLFQTTQDAVLEWTPDNRIRLHKRRSIGTDNVDIVFDSNVDDVRGFQLDGLGLVRITLANSKQYSVWFVDPRVVRKMLMSSSMASARGGLAGVQRAGAQRAELEALVADSGIYLWKDAMSKTAPNSSQPVAAAKRSGVVMPPLKPMHQAFFWLIAVILLGILFLRFYPDEEARVVLVAVVVAVLGGCVWMFYTNKGRAYIYRISGYGETMFADQPGQGGKRWLVDRDHPDTVQKERSMFGYMPTIGQWFRLTMAILAVAVFLAIVQAILN